MGFISTKRRANPWPSELKQAKMLTVSVLKWGRALKGHEAVVEEAVVEEAVAEEAVVEEAVVEYVQGPP